jgi:uncharacterized membrane protein YraQ (UPF0718 family)
MSDEFIKKAISKNNTYSVLKSSIIGLFTPLCSFGTPKFITYLAESKISKSVTSSFAMSTSLIGVDSAIVTYSAFGLYFTIYRIVTSVVFAVTNGILTLILSHEQTKAKFENIKNRSKFAKKLEDKKKTNKQKLTIIDSMAYIINTLFYNISKPLLLGISIGSLIMIFSDKLQPLIFDTTFLNYMLVLSIAIVVYACSTGSVVIAIAIISIGFTPGTAFLFLSAGPATNHEVLSAIYKELGIKPLVIYLLTIIFGSLTFAFILDKYFAYSQYWFINRPHDTNVIEMIASFVLIALLLKTLFSNYRLKINF